MRSHVADAAEAIRRAGHENLQNLARKSAEA
jgi:hypothetical protein